MKKNIIVMSIIVGIVGGMYFFQKSSDNSGNNLKSHKNNVVPVEVAPIFHGPIEYRRTFSGTLESPSEFVVSPKVGGRIERLFVDLGDPVFSGQTVAELDNDEYLQTVKQAEAELAVSKANLIEAQSGLEIAKREYNRISTLQKNGVSSDSQYDLVKADLLSKEARLAISIAQVNRAEATLESSHIRLSYTTVKATWSDGAMQRVVSERFVDEGETVSANTPLFTIVAVDPLTAVMFVTEKDYAKIKKDQSVYLMTDAYPGEQFEGTITRISPTFRQATRQARVEMTIKNPEKQLKPGMFILITVVLEHKDAVTIVSEKALTKRNDRMGIFLVSPDGNSVIWKEVTVGIKDDDRIEILGQTLSGRVVTLGQQFLDHGSAISIPFDHSENKE